MKKLRPWIVWIAAALFPMYQFMLQSSPSPMLSRLTLDLSISMMQASLITTFFFYSYIVMQIPAGILVDVVGPRILLIVGSLLAGVACLLFSCCKELWIAETSRLIMGFACAGAIVSTFALIARWFKPQRFALLIGLTETLAMAGSAIAIILLTVTVEHFGWRHAILFCGIIGISIALIAALFVRNHPHDNSWIEHHAKHFSLKEEGSKLLNILRHSQVWINGLYTGLSFSVIPAFFSLFGIPFFKIRYQISGTDAATLVSIGFLGVGIGSPFLGWLSDCIKRRKIIIFIGSLISTICLILIIHINSPIYLTAIYTFILGISCSTYILAFTIIKEVLPKTVKGKAMGFANMLCLLVGAPILQPIIAWVIDQDPQSLANYRKALWPLTLTFAISLVLSLFIKETYCHDIDA